MALFAEVLAPACVSNDSPKFLAFIPGAPTKASQLFDVVVSASAVYGGSWMEGSGAVFAENQALRWVADLAGLPEGAGGCFVSGGSAGEPLGARRGPRDRGARRAVTGPARWRVALGDQAHSSLESTIRIMDAVPLVVPTGDDDRLDGADLRAALDADPDPGSVFAVVGTGGTTNTGQIDDLDGHRRGRARARPLVPRRRRVRSRRARGAERARPVPGRRARGLTRRGPAQVAVRAVRLRGARLPRPRAGPARAHAARGVPRRDRGPRRVEPVGLRVPPDPACPRPAVLVLARGARHRRVHDRDRADPGDRA